MMQSMMEAMMGKMMESFFGGGSQWSSGATPMDNPKGKGKHGQMKGPGGGSMGEPPGAAPASGGPGKGVKGKDAGNPKGKPKGKDGHGDVTGQDADYAKGKPKGQGKYGGGAEGAKPFRKGTKDDSGTGMKDGGQGPFGANNSKGKGKGKIDRPGGESREWRQDGGWETIEWHAKPSAFGASRLVTTIAALEDALDQADKFVAQFKGADFEEAATMLEGGCPKGTVLIKDGEACESMDALQKQWPVIKKHVPGLVNGATRLRCVWVCTFGADSADLAPAVGFVKAAAPKTRRHHDTVVVRCCAWQGFADEKEFKQLLKRPGQFARSWFTKVAPLHIQEFIDSWGWQSYGEDQARGLVRLTKEAASVALRSSGCWALGAALFFTPLDWAAIDASEAPSLLWVDRQEEENAKTYLERVRKEADVFGLHCGGDRLAVRLDPLDARIMPQRGTWHLRGARFEWLPEDVESVLTAVGFTEVSIEAKLLRRGLPVWEFRAVRVDFRDFVPIELEPGEDLAAEGEVDIVLEASRVARRRKQGEARTLPAERVAKFGAINVEELVKQVAAPKRKSRFDKPRTSVAPAAPLEDMVVDTDGADEGDEVGQKRRRPEQGGRDGDEGEDSAGSASQPSSKCVLLPPGAKVHANPGGGDCLFYCLADVLSGVQNKTRGHRQVRAGVVAWMEKHTELLEQHWDHLGPDGKHMEGSFRDYLKAVRRSGAWAGWLELYAAGVAEDLNILILSPDGVVRFAARNEVGHFAVLKYECGHYEVLTMDQKRIAELWLAASDAKPVGGRGGGRSKASSLHLSQFDAASEGTSWAHSSLHLSAAAVQEQNAIAELDGGPAGMDGGAQPLPEGPVGGLALSEFASGGTATPHDGSARSRRAWPTPADLRSLSSAHTERPVVVPPRRRLRSKSQQWMPLSALASAGAGVTASLDDQEPGSPVAASPPKPQVPRPRKSKYRVDDVARWPCPLCPMVIESKSVSILCKLRYSHCHRHHEGQGLPGARRVCLDAFRALGPEEPDDWRCPLCDWGLPQGTRGQISEVALATAKDQHRQAKHPGVSRKEYDGKLKVRGKRKAVHVMQMRVRRLNAFAAKRQRDGVASFVGWKSFTWPSIRNSKSKERRALCLQQAWCCVHCGFCTRVAVCRKSHVKLCSTWDRSKLVGQRARLWKSYAEAKKLEHGVDPVMLLQVFENADLVMGGAGQPS